MIKGKEELLASIKAVLGDTPTDDGVALMEDFTDTFDDLEKQKKDIEVEWQAKYDANEKEWKDRYTSRFSETRGATDIDAHGETEETEMKRTFDELFEIK